MPFNLDGRRPTYVRESSCLSSYNAEEALTHNGSSQLPAANPKFEKCQPIGQIMRRESDD
eukprot:scaffold4266_cov83-Cylindrotheca_fusiformis.AAC.4